MLLSSWAIWISLAILIAALGSFIDRYHIKSDLKSNIRELLIRWFIYLDEHSIPDIAGWVIYLFKKFFWPKRLYLLPLHMLLALYTTITLFYFYRLAHNPPGTSYVVYILAWFSDGEQSLYWILFMLALVVPLILYNYFFSLLYKSLQREPKTEFKIIIILFALLSFPIFLGFAVCLSILVPITPSYGFFTFIGAISFLICQALILLAYLFLFIIKKLVNIAKKSMMYLFDIASSPENSPFTYFSALLSVFILLAKFIESIMSAI